MAARWSFQRFDWQRFGVLAPAVQAACESNAFVDSEIEGCEEIIDYLDVGIDPRIVANAIVTRQCVCGDAVEFELTLSQLIHRLRTLPRGEEVAEMLAALISAAPHVPDWCRAQDGLAGILTPHETQQLAAALGPFRHGISSQSTGIISWVRRLAATDTADDQFQELIELADEATSAGAGICVVHER